MSVTLNELTTPLRHCTDRLQFLGTIRAAAEAAIDVVADRRCFSVNEQGLAVLDGGDERYPIEAITRGAHRDVATKFDVPLPFYDRLYDGHRDLWAHVVTTLASRSDGNGLFRLWNTSDGWALRALLSDRYGVYDNVLVLQALTEGLAQSDLNLADDCEVSVDLTPDRFRLRLVVPSVSEAIPDLLAGYTYPFDARNQLNHHQRPGGDYVPPVLWAGIEITNSETGNGAFTIVPRAEVLICRNGWTRTQDVLRSVHLGGVLEEGVIEWSDLTRRRSVELLSAKVVDAVRTFINVDYLQTMVNEASIAKGIEVASPTAAIHRVQVANKLTDNETQRVMDAFLRGRDTSLLGIGQAVTAAAQLSPDSDRQAEMESMFWTIVGDTQLAVVTA